MIVLFHNYFRFIQWYLVEPGKTLSQGKFHVQNKDFAMLFLPIFTLASKIYSYVGKSAVHLGDPITLPIRRP